MLPRPRANPRLSRGLCVRNVPGCSGPRRVYGKTLPPPCPTSSLGTCADPQGVLHGRGGDILRKATCPLPWCLGTMLRGPAASGLCQLVAVLGL